MVITSNIKLATAPGNVLLSKKDTGLPKKSVANVSQIITLDKSFLTKKAGQLGPNLMHEVGMRLVLSL